MSTDNACPTQKQTLDWVASKWADRTTPIWRAAKLCEEAGETIGAVIKLDEGVASRSTTSRWRRRKS